MAVKTVAGMIAHVQAQVGQAYLYGEIGRVITPAIIAEKHRQYPDMTDAGRAQRALTTHVGKRGYDCSHLISSYWTQETPAGAPKYSAKYDVNAQGLYDLCGRRGRVGEIPEEPGLLVFMYGERRGEKRMTHVGLCVGGGVVVEARGFDYGVVRTKLKDRPWTHCGCDLKWFGTPPAPSALPPSEEGGLAVGDRVRILAGAARYFPGGVKIPDWLRKEEILLAQVARKDGRAEIKGGRRCVLLGRTTVGNDINSWIDAELIERA